MTHVGERLDRLAKALETLQQTVVELPDEHWDEVARRDRAIRQIQHRLNMTNIALSTKLKRKLNATLQSLVNEPIETRRAAACELIANAIAVKYKTSVSQREVMELINACENFGNGIVRTAACEFLDEPVDPNLRNIFAVLHNRIKTKRG